MAQELVEIYNVNGELVESYYVETNDKVYNRNTNTITTTTSETDFDLNYLFTPMNMNKSLTISGLCGFTCKANTSLTLRLKRDNTVLNTVVLLSNNSPIVYDIIQITLRVIFNSLGVNGNVSTSIIININNQNIQCKYVTSLPDDITWDTTTNSNLKLSAQWSNNSETNSIKIDQIKYEEN